MTSFFARFRSFGAGRIAATAGVGAAALLAAAWLAFGPAAPPASALYAALGFGEAGRNSRALELRRGAEGELARTLRTLEGVTFARVQLPEVSRDDPGTGLASVAIGVGPPGVSAEEVRAIQALVAAAGHGLKPDGVIVVDQQGRLLSADAGAAAASSRAVVEAALRERVRSLVEGVVGPGKAQVQVSADVDERQITTQQETFDPDSQVIRSVATSHAGGRDSASGTASPDVSTTSYEISKTVTTAVQPAGAIRRLSVAVAVDGITTPARDGRPAGWAPRSADEMQRIDSLVKAAIGYSEKRGDVVQVENLPLTPPAAPPTAGWLPGLGSTGLAELAVLAIVAALTLTLAAAPLLRARLASRPESSTRPGGGGTADPAGLDGRPANDAPALRRAGEFAEVHPEASARVLRGWLRETA